MRLNKWWQNVHILAFKCALFSSSALYGTAVSVFVLGPDCESCQSYKVGGDKPHNHLDKLCCWLCGGGLCLAQAPVSGSSHKHQDQTTLLDNLECFRYLSSAAEEQKKPSPDPAVHEGQLKEIFEMGGSARMTEHLSSPAYSRVF